MPALAPTPAELWFVTGSQHLYGPDALLQVSANAQEIASGLDQNAGAPIPIVGQPILTDADAIRNLCLRANADPKCAGLILWMHTFSPAKMWIGGLSALRKPIVHLHTQFSRDLPWSSIDMDFMNLNQSAHGDREAGALHARMRLARKVIVGHWQAPPVLGDLADWARVAAGWHDLQGARIVRIGDNMRDVSVTEGDKVSAEATFGFSINGYGVGDLATAVREVSDAEIDRLTKQYGDEYEIAVASPADSVREAARIEIGLRAFLIARNAKGFTTTFEDLHGLRQLPGLAVQRLMKDGYGFGAEGDWKMAALLRLVKVVGQGKNGGTSFMEDYTYDLGSEQVLGAHMLEVCPTIASGTPSLQVHPLGIGGKEDPARLVFNAHPGSALNASLVDLGNRFRLIVNEVEAIPVPPMPKLPVARALWKCAPDFRTACAAWIYAGGAHHTAFTYDVSTSQLRDVAEIAGIEIVVIDAETRLPRLRDELRWNDLAFGLRVGH